MTSVSMEEVNEDHVCTLCFELFLYPVTLPCKHVFCKQCLDRHIENNGFTCPICRHRLFNWLKTLKVNQLNIVDSRLWIEIQEKYPVEVEKRKNEDAHESLEEPSKRIKIIPKHNFAKPGEIRAEFDDQLRRFEQENEQLRISESLSEVIEISDSSGCETHVETDVTNSSPYACSEDRINDLMRNCDSPVFLGPCISSSRSNTLQPSSLFSTNHDQPTCSTTRTSEGPSASSMPLSSSPIPLDTPSCSNVDIFAKFWTSRNQVEETKKSGINMLTPPIDSTDSGGETLPMRISSSGADSIEQELCHFKPIRASSPTTPPKDGKSRWLPQVVVPQRSVSVEDLDESQALQSHLETDRELALKIQDEWASEEKKRKRTLSTGVKTDYNLRKKRKKDLRKKVLMDRRQRT